MVTEEKAADNYTMDSANRSQTVVVRPADGQTLTFFDAPAQGLTVQLYVKGTTEPIPGAKFLLTDGTGAKLGDENGEFTTDENGRFSLSGLKPGLTVKVKQISTPDGYILDGTPKTVTIKTDSEQTVTVYNVPKQTLTVRLYVKGTETPIPGAKFLLRDSGGDVIVTVLPSALAVKPMPGIIPTSIASARAKLNSFLLFMDTPLFCKSVRWVIAFASSAVSPLH